MPRSSLGKRTRSVSEKGVEAVIDTPRKRTRRSTAKHEVEDAENDENYDPDISPDEAEDEDIYFPSTKRPVRSKASPSKPVPVTPQTPRFRNALSRSPATPRHVVMSAGKLFKRSTPQTPVTPSSGPTIYHSARQLFARGADAGQLVGRDDERAQLQAFIHRLDSSTPHGCLYVSGPPGTGKSAMVQETTKKAASNTETKYSYINCMSIKSSKDLYITLLDSLNLDKSATTEPEAMKVLQSMFIQRKKSAQTYLVVLDEIDHILTMGLESLYRMFEWSLQKSSRLTLIGIANALDLTDRFLPRLKAKNLRPELLPFLPYTAPQIKNIILTRLRGLVPADSKQPDYVPFIHPAAVELCSRKVSSQTGDLRRAFEICRRALDVIEAETKHKFEVEARETMLQMTPSRKVLGETFNESSPRREGRPQSVSQMVASSFKGLTVETAPRVSISHLNKVTSAAFSNGTNQRLKTLNLQQKAALCALVAYEKKNRASQSSTSIQTPSKTQTLAPTVKTLFDAYCRLCKTDAVLHPLSSSEFREVVGSLETLGLVTAVDGKTGGLVVNQTPSKRGRWNGFAKTGEEKRVASCVGEEEVEQATDGIGAGILKSILNGDALECDY
ncbi:hypothetical protein jhhlp_007316 [Lomentospora prolificans]|uniref:Cell division control protein n=1 Tax=Lomentospora prolificans TaxID=41688 RepID=A0A2N3N2B0_9PEZI|nr:hypothetical protein jhhlp_007316 [Lomentospora prolificans]